jgi:class 3 adenylate cyclase
MTCTLEAILGVKVGTDRDWFPLLTTLSFQLPILIPLGMGMAWVSASVGPRRWRFGICAGAVLQAPLTGWVAGLFDKHFSPFPVISTLLAAAILPRLLARQQASEASTATTLAPAPPPTPSPFRPAPQSGSQTPLPQPRILFQNASSPTSTTPTEPRWTVLPKRTQATILHCELLNQAQVAQSLQPREFAELLNRMLSICSDTAGSRGGEVDRADSESFRAFFLSEKTAEPHAEAAVHVALALRTRLAALSEECELKSGHELDVRIGISTGETLVAAFGPAREHQRTSVAGECTDWSRRLASTNQLYGSRILVSSHTCELTRQSVELRPIDLLQRHLPPEAPEEVCELIAIAKTLTPDAQRRLTLYKEGFAHFRARRWAAARQALRAALPQNGHDDAIELLLHRIDEQESLAGLLLPGT